MKVMECLIRMKKTQV